MIYGRVIGSELRDVPPECLPVWGQRWSGYRAPHGPSPFSTRVFSADRMSEVGPALTSPSQFEEAFSDVDEAEDTCSESSRLYSSFSPLLIFQPDAAERTFCPETLQSIYHSSNWPHGSPDRAHQSRHPPLQNSTLIGTTLLPRQQFDRPYIHHLSEALSHPRASYHDLLTEDGRGSFEDECAPWNMDRTLTTILPPSHQSHLPGGQLQRTALPHSTPQQQSSSIHTPSSTYPFQPNSPPFPSNGYLLHPFHTDVQSGIIPATPPSSRRSTVPSPRQSTCVDSLWPYGSNISVVPDTMHSWSPAVSQWSLGSIPPDRSFTGPAENNEFPGVFSDHHGAPHPEDMLGTVADVEGCMSLSLDKAGGD